MVSTNGHLWYGQVATSLRKAINSLRCHLCSGHWAAISHATYDAQDPVPRRLEIAHLPLSGESSRSFLLNLLMVSSIVLPILSLISPNLSLNGNPVLLLSQSSSHLDLGSVSYRSPVGHSAQTG
uniref:Uncharacterized protein n=1 Tax=Engystomops pustulosus TaxID=76066 RepID=A0AAV6YMT9_ENGPU|nr:hypothetical protein GDO81_029412 [Engystomops pustulosus]